MHSSIHGILLVLLASVLWGTTGTAHSFAPIDLSAFWVGALRLAVAGVFFSLLSLWLNAPRSKGTTAMPWPRLLICAGCMMVYNVTFFAGLQYTGVGLGTTIAIGSSPIWAGLLQAALQRYWPNRLWWLGTCIGLFGGLVMTWSKTSTLNAPLLGIALCLLAGFSYGAYAVIGQPLFIKSGVSRVNAWVFFCASAIALPAAAWLSGAPSLNAQGLAVILYLGLIATGVAYLLFSIGLRSVSAATSVALSKFEPITAFVLSIVIVGEAPSWLAVCGLLLVLLGLWLVVQSEMQMGT